MLPTAGSPQHGAVQWQIGRQEDCSLTRRGVTFNLVITTKVLTENTVSSRRVEEASRVRWQLLPKLWFLYTNMYGVISHEHLICRTIAIKT